MGARPVDARGELSAGFLHCRAVAAVRERDADFTLANSNGTISSPTLIPKIAHRSVQDTLHSRDYPYIPRPHLSGVYWNWINTFLHHLFWRLLESRIITAHTSATAFIGAQRRLLAKSAWGNMVWDFSCVTLVSGRFLVGICHCSFDFVFLLSRESTTACCDYTPGSGDLLDLNPPSGARTAVGACGSHLFHVGAPTTNSFAYMRKTSH